MFMVGYPRTRGIGYTRMFLHKRPNNSLMNRPGKPGAVQEDFAMKKTNDTLLTNDPDCVKTRKFEYEAKIFPTIKVINGLLWDRILSLCSLPAYFSYI